MGLPGAIPPEHGYGCRGICYVPPANADQPRLTSPKCRAESGGLKASMPKGLL
jgi:hypothetical protein